MGFIKNSRIYILWLAAILLITQLPFTASATDFEMPFEMAADVVTTAEIMPANMPQGVTLRTIGPSTVITGQTHFFMSHVTTSYQALTGTVRWEVLGGGPGTFATGLEPINFSIVPGAIAVFNTGLRIAPNEPATSLTLRTILQVGAETSVLDKVVLVRRVAPRPPIVLPVVPSAPRPPAPPPPPTPRPPVRPLSPFAPLSTPGRLTPTPMPDMPEEVPLTVEIEAPAEEEAMLLHYQPLNVNLNGVSFNFTDQEAILVRGTSFIPVGPLFAHLDYNVTWDNETATARLTRRHIDIIISEGERRFTINGVNHTLPVAPMRVNDRLMVPFVELFESIGATTHRDINGIVHIYITR